MNKAEAKAVVTIPMKGRYFLHKNGSIIPVTDLINAIYLMTGDEKINEWKSNFERQCALIDEFYTKNNAPTYMDPDWEEPTTMTVKEIEKIIGHPFTVIEEEVGEDE